jgi:flagellar protein FlgJ
MLIPLHAAAGAATAAFGMARTAISAVSQAERRIQTQSREFESVFLAQVLNTMNTGIGENTGFDGGHAEGQWRSLLNEHLARDVAAQGGVGVGSVVQRELLRAQEAGR